MSLCITASALSHAGKVRINNEDNYYLQGHIRENVEQKQVKYSCAAQGNRFLAAVADGMGGEEYGEYASLFAVQSLRPCSFDKTEKTAMDSMEEANFHICSAIQNNGGKRMGSTLAALYMDDGKALCCNIGDSRCYFLRDGKLFQLSTDHNKAKRMVELGVLTPEQAARHPSRHELTQHLGIFQEEMRIQPAFSPVVELQPGDRFLLCSDGLTDMVTNSSIASCLAGGGTPEEQAFSLVQRALDAGGRDNVTVLVIQIEKRRRSLLHWAF